MRRFAVTAAVGAFALGVVVLVSPGVVRLDSLLLPAVAVGSLGLAARAALIRRDATRERTETPTPEVAAPAPPPGADLREVIAAFTNVSRRGGPGNLRLGLRSAAVRVLERTGYDEVTARELVASGGWTDDPVAGAFLGGGSIGQTVGSHLPLLGSESEFDRGVRRTVDAIVETARVPVDEIAGAASSSKTSTGNAGVDRGGMLADGDGTVDPESVVATMTAAEVGSRETGHWRGIAAITFAAVGIGVLARSSAVLLAAIVGLGYAAYARSGTPPEPQLAVERELADTEPGPRETVDVTVTVTNEGDRALPDLRLIDGVAPALPVTDGVARRATGLRSGESVQLTYTVEARRGIHEFGPLLAITRDLPGAHERTDLVEAPGRLTCVPHLRPVARVPLHPEAARAAGRVSTDAGGEGVEFYGVREYRRGDPPARVDWNRRARTGELTTIDLREERAATVVVVVDGRPAAHLAPSPDEQSAIDRDVEAAGRLAASLLDGGNRVGVAAFGADDCWLSPGIGRDHRAALRELLATHPALASSGESAGDAVGWQRRLRRRLPNGAQVIVCSPLPDGAAALFARSLDAHGYPVTVVSPDPTISRTAVQRLARLDRRFRIIDLRSAGVRVVDWAWDVSLAAALIGAKERWSR